MPRKSLSHMVRVERSVYREIADLAKKDWRTAQAYINAVLEAHINTRATAEQSAAQGRARSYRK